MTKREHFQQYTAYQELHLHEGTTKYEVATIVTKETEIHDVYFDNLSCSFYIDSRKNTPKPQIWRINHADSLGKLHATIDIANVILDGTILNSDGYRTYVFDGDTLKKGFFNPFAENERLNPDSWLTKYQQYYAVADAAFNWKDFGMFFIRIQDKVFLFDKIPAGLRGLEKRFPDKGLDRISVLPDLTPDFVSSEERDNNKSLLEYVDYNEKDTEEGGGINPINFSGGYHYLKLHMPGGDTIKFKRYGSMGVNIKTYKIPEEYGGRDDVVFIVQKRNPHLEPNKEWGGMYVIRPRGLVRE